MNSERRQWRRRLFSTTILFKPVEGHSGPFRSGQLRDISDGGVSFDTDDPPADGSLVDMFFKEHATAADQRVRGRVVWTRPGEVGLYAVGVSFSA